MPELKWTNVSDGLPPEQTRVRIRLKSGREFDGYFYAEREDGTKEWILDRTTSEHYPDSGVEAWALIPNVCPWLIYNGEGTYYAGCGLETDHVPASGICECKRQIVVERRAE